MTERQRLPQGLSVRLKASAKAGAAGILAGILIAGCGGGSSSTTARIRSVNLSPNGGTVGVLVNGAVNGGDLNFSEASPYNFIGQGTPSFSYALSPALTLPFTAPPTPTLFLRNGSFYTEYLIGRIDITSADDPRFTQSVVTGDQGAAAAYSLGGAYPAPPSGQANLRILNAAPDAGFVAPSTAGAVDVLINGQVAFAKVAYPAYPVSTGTTVVISGTTIPTAPAVTPVTPYQAVPGGTLSVQVNVAGTNTVLVGPLNISLSGGQAYTLAVVEPTLDPTYGLYTSTDD